MVSIRALIPALFLLPLAGGCSYASMPDWLTDMIGGQRRTGQYVDGPLDSAYVIEQTKLKIPLPVQDGAIRLQIAPSFGLYDYVLNFTPVPANCLMLWRDLDFDDAQMKQRCRIIYVRAWRSASENRNVPGTSEYRAFYLPEEDYRDIVQAFNKRLKNWRGRRSGMVDGTWIGLEQSHKGKIGSMTANAGEGPADNPLSQLARDTQRLAIIYGPTNFFPRSYDWHSLSDSDHPCWGSLSGIDQDGMDTGDDDACATSLKARPL